MILKKQAGRLRIAIMMMVLLMLGLQGSLHAQTPPANDTQAAATILSMVNEWRVQQGFWPLKVNAVLEQMAVDQASYVLPKLESITDYEGYHTDANGRNPRQRAYEQYGWPSYGPNGDRVEVGENTAIGNADYAMEFWQHSEVHSRAALSNVYREVGVAALKYKSGYLYMMEFGARPGVLTALRGEAPDQIYLTRDNSRYATDWKGTLQFRLFGAGGRALTDFAPWTAVVDLESNLTEDIVVLYQAGTVQAAAVVDPARDVAYLPNTVAEITSASVASPPQAAVAAVVTNTPAAAATQPPAAAFSLATNTPSAPVQVAAPTQVPATSTLAPTAVPAAELLILYDRNSLVVNNSAGQAINLNGIVLEGTTGRMSVERWMSVAPFPSDAFPAGHCLMAIRSRSSPSIPSACRVVRSQVELPPERVFWVAGDFTVKMGDSVLGTCSMSAGRCVIDLP